LYTLRIALCSWVLA